jgi:hypothetical protein
MTAMPWLDTCGRPADWGRSCYTTKMAFGVGQTPVAIKWYFADADQPWCPQGNQFVSLNWDGPDREPNDLGEQDAPRPWSNGKNEKLYPQFLSDSCGMDPLLQTGLSAGQTTSNWDAQSKLSCCDGAFDCTTLPSTLHVAITDLAGCGAMVSTYDINLVAPCVWQGGTPLFTLGYSMGAWFRSLNCPGGDPTWTQVAFTASPFKLVFDVLDTTGGALPALCCGLSGLDTFRVTVTD